MSNIYQVPAGHTIAITPTAGVPVHARRFDDAQPLWTKLGDAA